MKRILNICMICVFCFVATSLLSAEDVQNPADEVEPVASKAVNLDMQAVYGQYNNMYSTVNISHDQQGFVYYLRSYFKRSNDFGYNDIIYENTSFYENRISFTGNIDFNESTRMTIDTTVDGDSHGMGDNDIFSREVKEKALGSARLVKRISQKTELWTAVGGAYYVHRLSARQSDDNMKSDLSRVTVQGGGEIIWSASNRLRADASYSHYRYSTEDVEGDRFWKGTVIDDFRITNYIAVAAGLNFVWNEDYGLLAWKKEHDPGIPLIPEVAVSLKGLKYFSTTLDYVFDLRQFNPEDFYFAQKFVMPDYSLMPARVHDCGWSAELRFGDYFVVKSRTRGEFSTAYYNYSQVEGEVLTATSFPANKYSENLSGELQLFGDRFVCVGEYTWTKVDAERNVTYVPEHKGGVTLKYNGDRLNIEWANNYQGRMYAFEYSDETIDPAIIGVLGLQFKTADSFYAYLRVENLYNNELMLRWGYPEPGLTVLGGLRIVL